MIRYVFPGVVFTFCAIAFIWLHIPEIVSRLL